MQEWVNVNKLIIETVQKINERRNSSETNDGNFYRTISIASSDRAQKWAEEQISRWRYWQRGSVAGPHTKAEAKKKSKIDR